MWFPEHLLLLHTCSPLHFLVSLSQGSCSFLFILQNSVIRLFNNYLLGLWFSPGEAQCGEKGRVATYDLLCEWTGASNLRGRSHLTWEGPGSWSLTTSSCLEPSDRAILSFLGATSEPCINFNSCTSHIVYNHFISFCISHDSLGCMWH